MKALVLAPVDQVARLAASAIAQHLRSAHLREAAATRWAQALETAVTVSDGGLAPAPDAGTCEAVAGLILPDGRRARLSVSTQLLAGMMAALAGAAPNPVGPAPLSPAEEGLFAFLALRWTALWPQPPALDWIDGGAGLGAPSTADIAVVWHVSVGDQAGVARWSLPADLPPPACAATPRTDLPIHAVLSAGTARCAGPFAPGDLLELAAPGALHVGRRSWPIRHQAGRWRVAEMKEVRMPSAVDDLPVILDAVVGRITLTVGEVSGLGPGVVLPIAADATPIVTLIAGGQPIARGALVDDGGRAAVQITQLLDAPD